MYPPKLTDSLEESLQNLLKSLQRAGHHFSGAIAARVDNRGLGCYAYRLTEPLPAKAKGDVQRYVRAYLKACGWQVSAVRVTQKYVEVALAATQP